MKKNRLPVGVCLGALLILFILTLTYITSSAGMHRLSDLGALNVQGPAPLRLKVAGAGTLAFYVFSALSLFWSAFLVCRVWASGKRYSDLLRERDELQRIKNGLEAELLSGVEKGLSSHGKLEGLLPICSVCKRIRDEKGEWNRVESYIADRAPVQFTHSICLECARKLYPECYREV